MAKKKKSAVAAPTAAPAAPAAPPVDLNPLGEKPVVSIPVSPEPIATASTAAPAAPAAPAAAAAPKKGAKRSAKRKGPAAAAPSESNGHLKQRRTINWKETPVAVVVGTSPVARGAFPSEKEALKFIQQLPVKQRIKCHVGRFIGVAVETKITLAQPE